MKYIKLFIESIDNDSWYYKISMDEYLRLSINKNLSPWESKEVMDVTSLIANINPSVNYKYVEDDCRISFENDCKSDSKNKKYISHIIKCNDEWFLIWLVKYHKFYKCDQLDGLENFINENENKHVFV